MHTLCHRVIVRPKIGFTNLNNIDTVGQTVGRRSKGEFAQLGVAVGGRRRSGSHRRPLPKQP